MTALGTALLVAALAAACAGCLRRTGGPGDDLSRVDYVRRRFQSSLGGCADPTSGAPASCVHIEIEYVDATRATVELARAVAGFVRATVLRPVTGGEPPGSPEILRDDLYDTYRDLQRQVPGYRVPWRLTRTVTVACNTERVQGLVASEQSFTAGTGAIERVQYATFDTRTGRRIGLDDLVDPENRARVLDELGRRAGGVTAAPGVSDRAGPPEESVPSAAPDEVLVCPETLSVRWNRTAGAPLEAVVPRAELRALLRADAP